MKLSDLRGKPVVTLAEALKVGTIGDALVDTSYHRIEALVIRSEGRRGDYVVPGEQIRGIGPDAVTITSQDALQMPEQSQALSRLPSLGSIVNSRVVTEGGEVLGSIGEVIIDPTSGRVESLEYGGALGGLFGRHQSLNVNNIVGVGPGVVTVTEEARPKRAA